MNPGLSLALGAFLLWGFFPLYWKLLKVLPADMILSYRILWSTFFLSIVIAGRSGVKQLFYRPRNAIEWRNITTSTLLIGGNWWLYIWAVNSGYVLETSLGYFLNPLVSILLGRLLLGEKMNRGQLLAVGIVVLAVANLVFHHGRVPWIAVGLAVSFGLYGLFKKKMRGVSSLTGLFWETGLLAIPCLVVLWRAPVHPEFSSSSLMLLLAGGGIVTALPLYLFGEAASRLKLSTLGICQYLAPSLQFLLAVFVFHEPVTSATLFSFALVWLAIGVFVKSSYRR